MSQATPAREPKPECGVSGCGEPSQARGYCGAHYQRFRRHGDPLGVPLPREPEYCTFTGCETIRW